MTTIKLLSWSQYLA